MTRQCRIFDIESFELIAMFMNSVTAGSSDD